MLAPACPRHTAVSAQLLSGGLANRSFKVWLSDVATPVVIRVYVRDPSSAAREASILERIKDRVPVPEVIYVSPPASHPETYMVLRWVDGIPLDQALALGPSADARNTVRAAGGALAGLQSFQFATSGFFGSTMELRTPFPSEPRDIVAILERCLFQDGAGERLGDALTHRLWSFVNEHLDALSLVAHHSTLVHGDFNGLNVIVQIAPDPPQVAALIDWEYAHSGTPLLDLASMLRRPGRRLPGWFEQELVSGYRCAGGTLPENWKRVSRIVDAVRLCMFVRSRDAGQVAIEGVRALLESALADEQR